MKKLDRILEQADKIAEDEVLRIVKSVIKSGNNEATQFMMAMGTYFFMDGNKDIMYSYTGGCISKRLENFIGDYDNILRITGNPIYLQEDGTIKRNW